MTDDLIARLRDPFKTSHQYELEAADALEAKDKRIAELEVPLCIGRRTIGIMAEEGCWCSEDGRAVVAADELFNQDPYARIAKLEAALRPFANCTEKAGHFTIENLRAARAAMEKKDD